MSGTPTDGDVPPIDPATQAAIEAYRRGFTPIPLRPGEKRPARGGWEQIRYSGENEVWEVFSEARDRFNGQPNVGLSLGEASGGLVDVDLDSPKASRLAARILPGTQMITGRPARPFTHYWYVATDNLPAYKKFTLPDGSTLMELRSGEHQTVIPPSTHPSGGRYVWHGEPWGGEAGPERLGGQVLQARVYMLAMAATLLAAWPAHGSRHDTYLALAGGLLRYGGVDGETGGIHPLWERNLPQLIGILAEATDDDDGPESRVSEVYDSTIGKLRTGRKVHGFPRLAQLIGQGSADLVMDLARDIENILGFASRASVRAVEDDSLVELPGSAVSRSERQLAAETAKSKPDAQRDPLAERVDGWQLVDMRPYLSQDRVGPEPGVLFRSDGVPLLYQGRVNSLYGASESGKTWLALSAVVTELEKGGHAMVIDCEDGPGIFIDRLRCLGVDDDAIAERVAYLNPDEPLGSLMVDRYGHPAPNDTGKNNEAALLSALDLIRPGLVVVDGITSLYGMHSLNPNDAAATDRVTAWMKRLTNNGDRTVLMIDHTSKNATGGSAPTGSQHKIAMVQGSALHVKAITKPRRGFKGELLVYIGKDRPGHIGGYLREEHVDERLIADVEVDATLPDGQVVITIGAPSAGLAVVSGDQQRAAKGPGRPPEDHLAQDAQAVRSVLLSGPKSRREIGIALPDKISDNRLKLAVKHLRDLSVIRSSKGPGAKYELIPRTPVSDDDQVPDDDQ